MIKDKHFNEIVSRVYSVLSAYMTLRSWGDSACCWLQSFHCRV